MNRREMLKLTAGLVAGSLVPSWLTNLIAKPKIDLSAFCAAPLDFTSATRKFQLTEPFIQGWFPGIADAVFGERLMFRYGTDGRICVRVAAEPKEREGKELKLPPANTLDWSHDSKRGWKPWPKADYLLADETVCETCSGLGLVNHPKECQQCDGCGELFFADNHGRPIPGTKCKACNGRGMIGTICPRCQGKGEGCFHGIQRLGDLLIDSRFDAKMRKHLGEIEWWASPNCGEQNTAGQIVKPIMFRFDGGHGLLVPLDKEIATKRLR